MSIEIVKNSTFTILRPQLDKVGKEKFTIVDFQSELEEKFPTFKNSNLILDFSKLPDFDLSKIFLFSQLSKVHKKNDRSFVMVCSNLEFDEVPPELIVVPTLQEAKDLVEMEDIERDLGI